MRLVPASTAQLEQFANVSEFPPSVGAPRSGIQQVTPKSPLKANWHAPCKAWCVVGMVRRQAPSGRFEMTHYASSLVAQLGVGFASFLVSATCILAAVGPSQIAG
jgi:hypothetical protein